MAREKSRVLEFAPPKPKKSKETTMPRGRLPNKELHAAREALKTAKATFMAAKKATTAATRDQKAAEREVAKAQKELDRIRSGKPRRGRPPAK